MIYRLEKGVTKVMKYLNSPNKERVSNCNYIDFNTHLQPLTPGSPLTQPPGAVPQEKAGGRQGNTTL